MIDTVLPESAQPSDKRCLVVDDDPVFRDSLMRSLARAGYRCHGCNSAESARNDLQQLPPFQRALIDLKMGGASGLTLITPLREHSPDCRILILTGYASIATSVAAIKAGADNYLVKPAPLADILSALEASDSESSDLETAVQERPISVERLEWEHIQRVLLENDNNVSATARQLGMHRRTLQRKLEKKPRRE